MAIYPNQIISTRGGLQRWKNQSVIRPELFASWVGNNIFFKSLIFFAWQGG